MYRQVCFLETKRAYLYAIKDIIRQYHPFNTLEALVR